MSDWPIRVTTKTVHEINYSDFEQLVTATFPQAPDDYSIVASEETSNDSTLSYDGIDGTHAHALLPWDQEDFDKWGESKSYGQYEPSPTYILNELVRLGKLPEGNYVIEVCW